LRLGFEKKTLKNVCFHFTQYEHEWFWLYYDRLHVFLAHFGYCLEKWELLDIVYDGVNCEIRTLLEHWDFCGKIIDEECDLLDWLARIHINLRLVVLILTCHPLAFVLMPSCVYNFSLF